MKSVRFSFASLDAVLALKLSLPLLALLVWGATVQFGAQITALELIVTSARFRSAYWALQGLALLLAALSVFAWAGGAGRLLAGLQAGQARLVRVRPLALGMFLAAGIALPLLLFGFYGNFLLSTYPRLLAFVAFWLLGTSGLAAWRLASWRSQALPAALILASVYCAATFLNLVSTYPFSLEWSEVSRFYQASFYFSEKVYGVKLPLPVTHPTRYLLQSLPFVLSNSPLWLHRLWQAVLWIVLPLLTSVLLVRRLKLGPWRGALILWFFLYLMQGAVFYHLLPCIFIVLWGFDAQRPWRSLAWVVLASAWAGLSRVNWLPVPGALAAMLYVLETPWPQANPPFWRYLLTPLALGAAGLLSAAGAYALYIANSGVEDASQFGSAFTSDLLWQRLWPSEQFPLGVLPGIVLVSAPLLLLLWQRSRQPQRALGFGRASLILVILAVLFAGGLVVSVKIGGGTNLHNMDAYMVLLGVLAAYFLAGAYAPQAGEIQPLQVPAGLTLLAAAVPVVFALLFNGAPLNLPARAQAEAALSEIQQLVAEQTAQGREVLFISQRQLVTFHMVDAPLVHEYEKLFLMEMAISSNEPYLARFRDGLEDHRFGLIITDPLHDYIYSDDQDDLAAENNAWVRQVSVPALCAYETLKRYPELGIEILQPRIPKCTD
jgi:hypothetical protein